MYCKSCGSEIPDDAKFCPECGMAVESGFDDSSERLSGKKVTENIYLCPDGKYRWYYEFPMMKNPTLLFTIWKVLGISFGIVYLKRQHVIKVNQLLNHNQVYAKEADFDFVLE